MGILDKLIGGLNRVDEAVDNTEFRIFRDRRFEQADRLARDWVRNEGVLTGIKQRYNDATETALRVSWFAPELRHAGVNIGTGVDRISGLRLGTTLALSVDGDRAALDWDTMARGWHVTAAVTQRAWRKVPDEGVDDTAVDMRVLSRWKKWPRQRDTVESFERRHVFGQFTQNWDIAPALRGRFYPNRAEGRGALLRALVHRARRGRPDRHRPEGPDACADRPPGPGRATRTRGWSLAGPAAARKHGRVGRWTAIDRTWSARRAQDWKVGAAMGEAVEAARRQLKGE
ncbi:MAG: hypothetical protein DLM67_22755 [Candidatus Nephthysia bennettiae]|nr:MAG: hypothetical protein DLM67_22755 [Candidatus Dormibacteraeota bacterium]